MAGRDWPGRLRRREVLKAAGGSSVALAGFTAATTSVTADGLFWHYETDGPVDSSPTVVSGGTHYFGSDDNKVYALLPTGHPHWDEPFETGGTVFSSPNVIGDDSDGTVYVGSDDGNVYAIDAETGTEEWHFETFDSVASSPTVVDGTVYVGSEDGHVYALDAETGDHVWEEPFETGGPLVPTSPTVVDGTVFFGARDVGVYAVDAQSGNPVWDEPFEVNNSLSSPTVADGKVFFGAWDNNIYALDADTGDPAWDDPVHTDMVVHSTPTVADGTVYIGSLDGTLRALDTETGDPVWDDPFETEPFASSPTVVDDTVFIVTDNVYGISVDTGEETWRYDKTDDTLPFSSPTVYAGILFYGDEDGLYAVETPVSTSSEGTRVTLGTLGHTDAWAQKDTADGPYEIATVEELQAIEDDLDGEYVLVDDIDASATTNWNGGAGFDPIGDSENPFTGSFDGQGHAIDGLYIDHPNRQNAGLFANTDGAVIQNVSLDVDDVTGWRYVGGLVGWSDGGGEMTNVSVTSQSGTVSASEPQGSNTETAVGGVVGAILSPDDITDSAASVPVAGNTYVGGFAGYCWGTVSNSSATGATTGDTGVGGFAGVLIGADTTLEWSFASGVVDGNQGAGGLVGRNIGGGTVVASYATGSVTGGENVGGLVGYTDDSVTRSYATGTVDGNSAVGGLVGNTDEDNGGSVTDAYWDVPATGQADSDGGTGLGTLNESPPADEMTGSDAPDHMTGLDFESTWQTTAEYPVLGWQDTPAVPEAFLDHRETKLGGDQPALAHRIDNLSIQSVDDVDRMTTLFDALETAMTDDDISGAAGVEAAQRLIYAEQVLERWLEGASDAAYGTADHPDVNLAETTAVSLVRAALTLLLVSLVGKKIVAKRLNLGPVAEHLLDIVLKLVKKIVGWLADHLLSSQIGATSMAIIEGKARALTDQLGNDEFDAVDELQSAVEDVVDTTTDTLGDAFQSAVGESGPDGGLTAELGSLESAFGPATIASEGLDGSLSGAQAGRNEYLGRLDDTFITAASQLEQFEEEYDTLFMIETAMDMYHETENEALGAVLGLLGALVGVLEDVVSIIKEVFGGAVVGLPAMLKAGDRRALGVQSVIEGEVQ